SYRPLIGEALQCLSLPHARDAARPRYQINAAPKAPRGVRWIIRAQPGFRKNTTPNSKRESELLWHRGSADSYPARIRTWTKRTKITSALLSHSTEFAAVCAEVPSTTEF